MSLLTQNNYCSPHSAIVISNNSDLDGQKVVRRFINSAVYVEKVLPNMETEDYRFTTYTMPTRKKTLGGIKKTLKCCCGTDYSDCPCHPNNNINNEFNGYISNRSTNSKVSEGSFTEIDSQITVKERLKDNAEFRLSLTSLSTQNNFLDSEEKEEIIKNWIRKKQAEKRQRLLKEQKKQEKKQKRREEVLEMERDNFKRWLADKKQEEILRRQEKQKEMEELKQKEEERQKRQQENDLTYKLWLQRKKKDELEKKIRDKIKELEEMEERDRRIEENKIAFQEWVKHSKGKPKPLPSNQGLTSLCSSLSVTYINPVPWTPNIKHEFGI
ncbi:unnamed protein product [Brassicogethes aeneus]|uniref:Coiled-coil domain-containing protein n=1 Tax=Brassicogethes aeneus TaxID=1431903 RepID=A0A9P0B2Q6_BRAAE|nr:unnamed protein product [Brassicogethes aeneus]